MTPIPADPRWLATLPTPDEMYEARKHQPLPKGQSRLQVEKAEKKLTVVDERTFRREVWTRDHHHCVKCGRKVLKTIARVPERGDVHHLHGRRGDLRFESRCAILVCCECHEQLTGRVAEKWIAVGSKFWTLKGQTVIDARAKITFKRLV